MKGNLAKIISIANFFGKNIQKKLIEINQNFCSDNGIELTICDLVDQINQTGINSQESLFMQHDLMNILVYYHEQNKNKKILFYFLDQKNLIRTFRKIIKKNLKYYLDLDQKLEKILEKEEDELDKSYISKIINEIFEQNIRSEFLAELSEATDLITFLDNQKIGNETYINIFYLYLSKDNLK